MKYIPLLVLLLSGCTLFQTKPPVENVVYVTTPLYAPERPVLPTWKFEDIKCLPQDVIQKMVDRDMLRKNYIEKLEAIIKSTQK